MVMMAPVVMKVRGKPPYSKRRPARGGPAMVPLAYIVSIQAGPKAFRSSSLFIFSSFEGSKALSTSSSFSSSSFEGQKTLRSSFFDEDLLSLLMSLGSGKLGEGLS